MKYTKITFIYLLLFNIGCSKSSFPSQLYLDIPAEGNSWNMATKDGKTVFFDYNDEKVNDVSSILRFYYRIERAGEYKIAILTNVITHNLKVKVNGHNFEKSISLKNGVGIIDKVSYPDTGYFFMDIDMINPLTAFADKVTGLRFIGEKQVPKISFVTKDYFYWGRRGPSVHLNYYDEDNLQNVEWFYNEVTVAKEDDVVGSFYMANGFKHGYFGIQTNSEDEKRVLFSVWSPFNTDDPSKIPKDQRVELLAKGIDVVTNDFGNEGSGGQSFLRYNWQADQSYKFLLRGKPSGDGKTIYSAWVFTPEKNEWVFIAKWNRPLTDEYLSRYHSFLENFLTHTGPIERKVTFSNQWICDTNGNWKELVKAKFTADATARAGARKDFGGGLSGDAASFYLNNCGFFSENVPYDTWFERKKSGVAPSIDFSKLEGF